MGKQDGLNTLGYAVRGRVIVKYLGQLIVMVGVLALVPAASAVIFREYPLAIRFGAVAIGAIAIGLPMNRLPAPRNIQTNEALVVVAGIFLITPLLMLYPMLNVGSSVVDSLFEAVSAVTTTGLTTINDFSEIPRSLLLARAWMQWYGGLGIVVLSVALMMGHHVAARRLAEPATGDNLVTTARTHARHILIVYGILSGLGLVTLWIMLDDGFAALTLMLSAVSTGGFAIHADSLAGLASWPARYIVIALGVAAAVPLILYYRAWHDDWRDLLRDVELRGLLLLGVSTSVLLSVLLWRGTGMPVADALRHGVLMGLSAQTTTGFSSLSPGAMDAAAKIVMIAAMLIGGSVGSTAGGIKILRLFVALRLSAWAVQRTRMPGHAVAVPQLGGKALREDAQNALLLIIMFLLVVLVSWFIFVVHGYEPTNALFEVVSACGTVGLSTGITSSALPVSLKYVLIADMLLGRLEIVALLVVLYPPTWFGRRTDSL